MIKRLNMQHIQSIKKIEKSNSNESSLQSIIDSLNSNNEYHFFGLFSDRNLIGYYYVRIVKDFCELFQISVHKELQGNGIGSILLNHCIDYARKMKCIVIELELRKSNSVAMKMYHKYNFLIVSSRKNYYQNPTEDAILMSLKLKS
jgi:[ribosomal protein S18]-alanine N-acetyltransferase